MRRQFNRSVPDEVESFAMGIGAAVSWLLFGLIYRFATPDIFRLACILAGPCILVLTYFAFGGNIPLRWRRKGYPRLMLVPIVFWISFVTFVMVQHWWPLNPG